jgi:hypothetical protein
MSSQPGHFGVDEVGVALARHRDAVVAVLDEMRPADIEGR